LCSCATRTRAGEELSRLPEVVGCAQEYVVVRGTLDERRDEADPLLVDARVRTAKLLCIDGSKDLESFERRGPVSIRVRHRERARSTVAIEDPLPSGASRSEERRVGKESGVR